MKLPKGFIESTSVLRCPVTQKIRQGPHPRASDDVVRLLTDETLRYIRLRAWNWGDGSLPDICPPGYGLG